MMAPILNEVAEATEGSATIYKLNVDEQQQVAAQYGIRSIPTMILSRTAKRWSRKQDRSEVTRLSSRA